MSYKKDLKIIDWATYFKCSKCWKYKTAEYFHKDSRSKYNVQSKCIECRQKYVEDNKDSIAASRHKKYLENKDKVISKTSNYRKKMSEKIWFWRERFHQNSRWYIKDAWIKFDKCFYCWKTGSITIHHPSYKNRWDWKYIVPVCRKCHRLIHNWKIKCPEPINLIEYAPWFKHCRRPENIWKY